MNKKENLYMITAEFKELEILLEKKQGEMNEHESVRYDELLSLIETKTDSSVGYIKQLEDTIENVKTRIKEFTEFKKYRENELQRFKDYVLECLKNSRDKKFSGDIYELKIKKPLKVVYIDDKDKIPIEYLEETKEIKIDKKALKQALSNEVDVPGVSLVDSKKSFSIKIRG